MSNHFTHFSSPSSPHPLVFLQNSKHKEPLWSLESFKALGPDRLQDFLKGFGYLLIGDSTTKHCEGSFQEPQSV